MSNSSSRQEEWAKWVTTGSADTLFDTYPDDDDLAEKVNGLLIRGQGVVTPEQVRRDRERYHLLPRRGAERDDAIASPTKNVILNKAQQLIVPEALAEIIDNIFDNFERNTNRSPRLEIKIVAYPPAAASPGELVVRENSGGIPNDRVVPLIQLGSSDRESGSIGAWGEGFKMAVFALGQEVEIVSSFTGEQPKVIYFPKGWLDPNNQKLWTQWKVPIYEVERNVPDEGTTVIRVGHLHQKVVQFLGLEGDVNPQTTRSRCTWLASYFGEVYAEKYYHLAQQGFDVKISIQVGTASCDVAFLESVETRLRQNLAFLPWLRPIRWRKEFEVDLDDQGRHATLEMTLYAGLAATEGYSPRHLERTNAPGVEMWGNGRLFSLKSLISDESVGWGYTFGGRAGRNPLANASSRRITIVALFGATDSRDIPWAAPVKNDYNRRSEFYAELRETFARVVRLFKDSVALLEFVLALFSASWNSYDEERKLSLLFRDTDAEDDFIDAFKESRFGRKVLAYQPTLAFADIVGGDAPTVHNLYNIDSTQIRGIVAAAAATKQSAEKRVAFLEAILPALKRQADIENEMGLSEDERFTS